MSRLDEEGEDIPKTGTIAWHQYHINRLSELRKESGRKGGLAKANNALDDFMKKSFSEDEYSPSDESKDPPNRYNSRVEYDFLKYIRVAFKWAVENHTTLTRSQIELLLYLYNMGPFSMAQFNEYHKLVSIYHVKTIQQFIDEGYVKVWRVGDGKKSSKLYALTQKAKILCSRLHKICCGLEEISLNANSNKMIREGAPRINNYYLDVIKKMNQDKADMDSVDKRKENDY